MPNLPLARMNDLVVQDFDTEVLIYDLTTNKAYHLNEILSIIYQACDGNTSFANLKVKHKFTDDLIFLALDELNRENLLEQNQPYQSPWAGLSRREVIRKIGLASIIALPAISSVVAPAAAHGASLGALFAACASPADCASNFCTQGPPRCCVPGTFGIRGANVCCDGTLANCNSQCCSNTGTISPSPGCAPFGGPFIISCPNS